MVSFGLSDEQKQLKDLAHDFRKKEIADAKFKNPSWLEVIMLYKSYKTLDHKKMKEFIRLYEKVKHEN